MGSHAMETPLLTATRLVESAASQINASNGTASNEAMGALQLALKLLRSLDPYLDACSSQGPPVLHDLLRETETHDWKRAYAEGKVSFAVTPGWSAGGYEGAFIGMVARATRARRVLEVGMFTGTTTLAIADALPEGGKVITLEIDAYFRDLAAPYFAKAGVADKVDVRIGKALKTIEILAKSEEPFDLIFIDADKGAYQIYFDLIMKTGLLKKAGVMLVDNTLYKGTPILPELESVDEDLLRELSLNFDNGRALAAFNNAIKADTRVEATILPIRDGVTWIMHKQD